MGVALATLQGHRVTSARVDVPAWGAWYAEVSIDGEQSLKGAVDLVLADLTLKGTILSGGPDKGRSHFRIVAGAGGWGRPIPKKSYANDAGVKLSKVLSDAAAAVGETIDVTSSDNIGPAFVRPDGRASTVLEIYKPRAWYVDEAGVTRLGTRTPGKLPAGVTHEPVDRAMSTVKLASDAIASILPGLVVDGLTAVDVEHTISAEDGLLRSRIWGEQGTSTTARALDAMRTILENLDPRRRFRGVTEYRVVTRSGNRLNLQPVRVSTGMPDLSRVTIRPGVSGCNAEPATGSRVLVGFVDSDPSRPYVASFEDADASGFIPASLKLHAAGSAAGEHVMTAEATALLIYNTLVSWCAAAGGGPLLAAVLQPLIMPAITAAISAQAAPAPPGLEAQTILATTLAATMAAGTTPSPTSLPFNGAIAAVANKTSNVSGYFPSVGSAAVEAG